jgi:hypothetical protein
VGVQLPIGPHLMAHAAMASIQNNPQHAALTRWWNFRTGGPRIYREAGHKAFVDPDEDSYRLYPRQPWDATPDGTVASSKTPP